MRSVAESGELLRADGFAGLGGDYGHAAGSDGHRVQLRLFGACPGGQQWAGGVGRRERVVHHPRPRVDVRAFQVTGQSLRLGDGRRLRQSDHDDLGVVRILEPHQRGGDVAALVVVEVAGDVAVVGTGGVHQEQGVAGGGGIHDDELMTGLVHGVTELLKDSDLLGAGAHEIFGEGGAAGVVELGALGGHDVVAVFLDGFLRVDGADLEPVDVVAEGGRQVRGGVSGGEQDFLAALNQGDSDGGCDGGLADTALAHRHHEPMVGLGELVDQAGEVRLLADTLPAGVLRVGVRVVLVVKQGGECLQADHVDALEAHRVAGQGCEGGGHSSERGLFAVVDGAGQVVGGSCGGQDAVNDQVGGMDVELGELVQGAGNLAQRGLLGPGDEHQAGAGEVGEGLDGGAVGGAILLESAHGPQAGRVTLAVVEVAGPAAGQLQQADSVAGGGGVEDDVVVAHGGLGVGEQVGELVERGDLGGAGARQLLGDGLDLLDGQDRAHWFQNLVAVGLSGLVGVDLQRVEAGHLRNRGDLVADGGTKHLGDVARRVGADQQHPLALAGEMHGRGARDAGLADTALASEEKVPGRVVEQTGSSQSPGSSSRGQQQPVDVAGASCCGPQHPPSGWASFVGFRPA